MVAIIGCLLPHVCSHDKVMLCVGIVGLDKCGYWCRAYVESKLGFPAEGAAVCWALIISVMFST